MNLLRRLPLPPTNDKAEDMRVLGLASLEVLVFLFEIFMIVAFTDGAALFLFDRKTMLPREIDTFNLLDVGLFIAFVLTSLKFAHSSLMYLQRKYRSDLEKNNHQSGFKEKGWQPSADFFFLFIQAGILYVVSHTFAEIDQAHMKFFILFGLFFSVDVLWSVVMWYQDKDRAELLLFAIINAATLLLGLLVLVTTVFQLYIWSAWLLLGILLLRDLVDYTLSYRNLFPGVSFSPASSKGKGAIPLSNQPNKFSKEG